MQAATILRDMVQEGTAAQAKLDKGGLTPAETVAQKDKVAVAQMIGLAFPQFSKELKDLYDLIVKLGDENFMVREKAHETLLAMRKKDLKTFNQLMKILAEDNTYGPLLKNLIETDAEIELRLKAVKEGSK